MAYFCKRARFYSFVLAHFRLRAKACIEQATKALRRRAVVLLRPPPHVTLRYFDMLISSH